MEASVGNARDVLKSLASAVDALNRSGVGLIGERGNPFQTAPMAV